MPFERRNGRVLARQAARLSALGVRPKSRGVPPSRELAPHCCGTSDLSPTAQALAFLLDALLWQSLLQTRLRENPSSGLEPRRQGGVTDSSGSHRLKCGKISCAGEGYPAPNV